MQELKSSFQFDETPGQAAAIEAVTSDMEKDSPVDRLVCGDVGFGKTEVALRAALKSIVSGKKVLLLTPTTILADQHFISTKARFEPLGIRVELLSRFKTKKQQQEILEKMLTGSTDLVIGTHRLLSQDVNFPDLGLLIIDEEHRFGVKHKDKLRQLRSTVDVITLTATPIPRTLQQSLLGIRDISRISTPPKTRRPIKTFIHYLDWKNIKEVIGVELNRGGQIYFLHNDIASIPFILKKMLELFPCNTLGVAHGKMNSSELENTVLSFFSGDIDILLCTTIIESGLDVSNANTIIINNAQNFGLSQLYQIRGRVGRSHRQAYCYLLVPKGKTISENARKRLKAIEQYTSLGSGYEISLKDLEIRGAGNLFGYKQSGHIATVGFEMYCKILQEAVDETTGNTGKKVPPKISIPINALLDRNYIQLVQDRLYFYQQLADASLLKTVDDIEEELKDRFGKLPKSALNLFEVTRIRIRLTGTSISSVSIVGSDLKVGLSNFVPYSSVDELIREVGEKLALKNIKFQFTTTKNGLVITALGNNIVQSIRLIELFVELFYN
jgi:transcription-repair coupling factor (superfamily II helicase)